jgi:protocatechuate 3,4-dioxygenase beta subunit
MNISGRRIALLAVAAALAATLGASANFAQDTKREADLRTVRGAVIDRSDTPVASAVVYLKNTRNNVVRTYISDNAGNYRFSGLDPNVDYEIHAEKDGAKSQTHTVSNFDSRRDIVLNLKLAKKA